MPAGNFAPQKDSSGVDGVRIDVLAEFLGDIGLASDTDATQTCGDAR